MFNNISHTPTPVLVSVGYNQGIKTQQDRKCTYNVTMRGVLSTNVAVEEQKVLHIMSICLQP
jgi:hypothetical protein